MRQVNDQSRFRPGRKVFQPLNGDGAPVADNSLLATFEDGIDYNLIATFEDGLDYTLLGDMDA